jgi:HSP20 family protein
MKLARRNYGRPTSSFPSFWNEFFADDFFGKQLATRKGLAAKKQYNVPAVNIKSDGEHYFIEVASPGFKKGDFKIELEDGVLAISAKHEINKEESKDGYTLREFVASEFKRTFTLEEDTVDVDNIGATYDAGVLVISIPKKEVKEEEVKKLNIDVL